ncbi:MAG: hypothetical protein ABIN80_08200 [Dyadobacter sp.]|uniref:hypothetical protein n=1 Tax=Dyadobacter sp. TaxID=1914288 RepID=UPI003265E730
MKIFRISLGIIFILNACNSAPKTVAVNDLPAKPVALQIPSNILYADIDPFISVKGMTTREVTTLFEQMLTADQQYRDSLNHGNKQNEALYLKKMVANDEANLKILDKIVQEFGWPEIDTFGAKAAETAWLIIWHQRGKRHILCKYFDLMESAVARKQMNAASFNQIKDTIEQLSPDQVVY